MKKYLRIRNWEKYQHYKDRNPAWIKLYTDIFQDYEFACLQDASKLLAICTMTLAARYKDPKLGVVPCDITWIKNQCNLGDFVTLKNLKELVDCGFLEDASNALAGCYQDASLEKETETEVEVDNNPPTPLKGVTPPKKKRSVFKKPTLDEVKDYCNERCSPVDSTKFWHFYESKGWKVGKEKMKNWKSAVVNWETREKQESRGKESSWEKARQMIDNGEL